MLKLLIFKDESGHLRIVVDSEEKSFPIRPIRYFPLTQPKQYCGFFAMGPHGEMGDEVATVSMIDELDPESKAIVEDALERSSHLIRIEKIYSIQDIRDAYRWHVQTNKKDLIFNVTNIWDTNVFQFRYVLIKDADANMLFIDMNSLDPKSLSLLDTFL